MTSFSGSFILPFLRFAWIIAACFSVTPLAAEPQRAKGEAGDAQSKLTPEQARELYIRRKRTLEQIKSRQEELSRDSRDLQVNQGRLKARLVEAAEALKNSEKRLSEIEEVLTKARERALKQRLRLREKTAKMAALFAVMQQMGRQPPPLIITHSQDALNMIRSGMMLSTFYADLEKIAGSLAGDLAQVEAAQKEAELQEAKHREELSRNKALKSQIDLLLVENQEQIESTHASLEGLHAVTKIHAENIKNLEEMIRKQNIEVGKKSKLADYESELVATRHQELSPDRAKLALQSPRMKPAIPFAKSQGLLPYPAQGKMIVKFGQTDKDGAPSKGMHFETRAGAQVVSPCDGWIIYAGPFRTYGQLLIINAGGGYHVVIAGMDRVQASVGQFVLAGEPIAVMGPLKSHAGEASPVRPTLYIEFRKDKQSIDPAPWWSAGVGKG